MAHRLYVVPGSHPCAAVEAALGLKGIAYERVDLLPVVHAVHQQLAFGGRTVPGLRLDTGEKVLGSLAIVRRLEELVPEPALLPADRERRKEVERAEEWGEEVLQPLARRVAWAALARRRAALRSYAEGARLAVPVSVAMLGAPLVARIERRLNGAGDPAVRADLLALPGHLDRIDRWIGAAVLGAAPPNAADLQVAASVRLLATIDDLAPVLADRPARALALRLIPTFPGRVPAGALPAAWLA